MSVAAVILAAGGGRRFNEGSSDARPGAKLLALLGDRPVVRWAVEPAIAAGFDEVIVVGGAIDLSDVLPADVTVVVNDRWEDGQATSLQAGLRECGKRGHDRAVIGLGDLPGLTSSAWGAVRDEPGGPIVFATYDGRRGHPVRLDAPVWSLLPTTGDEGARRIARERPELVREVACSGTARDIDVPSDLERWE